MKIYIILFFSILVLPLFGQQQTLFYQAFQIQGILDGKYHANSLIEGKLDTIIIKNEISKPKYTSKIAYHPEAVNLIEVKNDTTYFESEICVDNVITTISYYEMIKANYNLERQFVTKKRVKFPMKLTYQIIPKEDYFICQTNVIKAIYETKSDAVLSQMVCTQLFYKKDTTQITIPNQNCHQYYNLTIHKYYKGKESWSENIITIDESTRRYEEKIYYRQENTFQQVEVFYPEVTLIKAIQTKLKEKHYYKGKITGNLDFATQVSILNYQKANHLPQGQLDLKTIKNLKI